MLIDFFCGRCVVSTSKNNASKLINICMKNKSTYRNPHFIDENFIIECDTRTLKKLKAACEKRRIEVHILSLNGLPYIFSKYRKRIGLFAGGILSVLLVLVSLNVVWRIEISGNDELGTREIEELLAENGFALGTFISHADLTFIENGVMQSEKRIAWLSININGTVANVEVRETRKKSESSRTPTDLVAVRDGKIERIEAYNGNCLVKVGDVVHAGDVLVSGVYQNEKGDYRVTRAEGDIFARTVREFSLEVPFENIQKVSTGRCFNEFYINFFKKSLKVFANTGNLPSTCDIIYKTANIGFSQLPKIPVGYEKITYSEYKFEPVLLDETEAMNRAFDMLEEELERISPEAELIQKDIDFEITDSGYILKCRLVCIENIATVRENN